MDDLKEFISFSKSKKESQNSWNINLSNLNTSTYDLSPINPNILEKVDNRSTDEIVSEIEELNKDTLKIFQEIKSLI